MDAERLELALQVVAGLGDVALALLALLVDQALDLLVLARVQRREREVLELPLDRVDAEPVRDRRVDLERLLGLVDLLLLGHRVDRAHVVQAIGELDQDDPDVRGHRDHHLAVVLGLRLVARLERDAGQLGDAVDERRRPPRRTARGPRRGDADVSSTVSCSSAAQSVSVSRRMPGADLRDADRVDDEVLARLAPLVGVVLAGEDERLLDALAVDLDAASSCVLLDDREQVAEQAALRRSFRSLRARSAAAVLRVQRARSTGCAFDDALRRRRVAVASRRRAPGSRCSAIARPSAWRAASARNASERSRSLPARAGDRSCPSRRRRGRARRGPAERCAASHAGLAHERREAAAVAQRAIERCERGARQRARAAGHA